MKMSFSQRRQSTNKLDYQIVNNKISHQNMLKNVSNLKRISKNNKNKYSYINRIVTTQNSGSSYKKMFDEKISKKDQMKGQENKQRKVKTNQNCILKINNQKVNKNQQRSFTKDTILNKQNCVHQDNFINKQKISTDRSLNKSRHFIDKHLNKNHKNNQSALNLTTNNLTYKRFDITKLDFSFNNQQTQQQITTLTLNRQKQYASLVSKSRSNIKKIIQLNNFLKANKTKKYEINAQNPLDKFVKDIQIIQKIKKGCFGTVFKARILSTGKIIAIKSVLYDRKHHQRQEQICKIVDNPFIVKIHQIYYTTNIQTDQLQKKNHKTKNKTQNKPPDFIHSRNNSTYKKSTKLFLKQQTNQKLDQNKQNEFKQVNINQDLKKNTLSRSKSNKINEHYNQYHRVINIAMDFYDCDLNDYIAMRHQPDNLTLKLFCYQMLRSILYLHSHQICHRDIKPHNFLVKKHNIVLTDFGSAKIMKNHKNSNVSYICSRYYRAPQLILGYKYYDKSIDIWALGCVMAQLSLGKPLFQGTNSLDQLVKIIRVLGEPNWRTISFMIERIPKIPQIQPKSLKNVFSVNISPLFIDLLQNMLVFNPLQRITAGQALSHAYFDQIRDQMNYQQICKQMDISHFLKFNRDQLKQNEHLKNKLIPVWMHQFDKSDGFKSSNYMNS